MGMATATWKPHTTHESMHKGDARKELPDSAFAFLKERKEPLTDADHVRNAMARFDQVDGVSDQAREIAWANIKKAADHFKVEVAEKDWRELGKQPHAKSPKS
jgi:hypothetical protein